MGELIRFPTRKPSPEETAHLIQRLVDIELNIGLGYENVEKLERQSEIIRRRLGYLAIEKGIE